MNNDTTINKLQTKKKYLFPEISNKSFDDIKIDTESYNFVTQKNEADKISKIIVDKLNNNNINKIIDITAGVGGNVLSFSKYFNHVYAVEIDRLRSSYLENNCKLYNCNNVTIINEDSYNIICNKLITDISAVFFDPPWGGKNYKNIKNLRLKLNNTNIEDICKIIYQQLNNVSIVTLKLPHNYDIKFLENELSHQYIFEYHFLKKMLIVILTKKI
jgi:tRNA/tmRNA/rRNA uracil-C5-methylase (TrmA/RlmC/RlmD family)